MTASCAEIPPSARAVIDAWRRGVEEHRENIDQVCRATLAERVDDMEWQRAIARWNRKHR